MSETGMMRALDDAALNLSITECARIEAATAGRRLAAIAELAHRRLGSVVARERRYFACDAWDSCAAEVGADLVIGHRAASAMLHQALDLRDRIPHIGALLADGRITLKVATTASWRTRLIEDDELLARVDADIAAAATRFGSYSEAKLCDAIDSKIEKHDPDAVRRFKAAERGLDMRFGKPDDETGTCSVFGRVKITDAELSERRMDALARSVCPDDPRTRGERRTEAFGIINAGGDHLPCLCGKSDCTAPTGDDARGKFFEIVVITDYPHAGDCGGPQDGPNDDTGPGSDDDANDIDGVDEVTDPKPRQAGADSAPDSASKPCSYTSLIAGGGVVPEPLLAELRRLGAGVRPVTNPEDLGAETGYGPSTALRRFIRARDTTCCFVGCDRPAEYCDADHTIPYDTSRLTHPGNLKSLCRKHHLLKTFWVGRGGWTDEQLGDGTVVWTSPSGLRHLAPPGSRIHFPDWDTATPVPDITRPAVQRGPGRELRMPLRKHTRAQRRLDGIRAERKRNRRLDADDPAPF